MRINRLLIIVLCIFGASLLHSQDVPQDLQLQLETYLEELDIEELDIADIIIRLDAFRSNPINLNKADYDDLRDLMLLNEIQIQDILRHRLKYGDFLRAEELQTIPSMDMESIRRIMPFVGVKDKERFNYSLLRMAREGNNQVFLKWRAVMEDQKGYFGKPELGADDPGPNYLGDKNRYFVRYKHSYENRLRYGFTLEKDAGEEFFTGSNSQGFDYMTAHVYLKDYSTFLKDLAIGDFSLSMGQGLIDHNDFGAGKSAYVNNTKKGGRVFKPYNSVNENDFYRGIGATLRPIKNVELSLMGSIKKLDATLADDDDLEGAPDNFETDITTLRIDGYHRTASEIANEKSIDSWQVGGVLKYKQDNFHLALNFLHNEMKADFAPNLRLYKKYQNIPNSLTNVSADYAFRVKNFNFFGEVATNDGTDFAQVHGLLLGLDRTIGASIMYRNYSPGYIALSPNAFGESANIENEEGLYLGIEIRPVYAWKFSAYTDVWRNPWLKFQVDRPGKGKEYLARMDYIIKRKLNVYAQYAFEEKSRNYNPDELATSINGLEPTNRHRLRLHLSYKLNKSLELRSRAEFHFYSQSTEQSRGQMLFQDLIYKPLASKFSMTARYMIFDTDSYDSRIYAYENDILYEFFIPAFANKGIRYYVNFRYNLTRWLTSEFRFARTQYENLEQISSGNNQINGDTQTELKAQLVFRF